MVILHLSVTMIERLVAFIIVETFSFMISCKKEYLYNKVSRTFIVKLEKYRRVGIRAREIVGFAGSGPIFETENRFISHQEAEKSVHKTLYFQNFAIYRLTL